MKIEKIYGELWVVKKQAMPRLRQQAAAQWNAGNSLSEAVRAIGAQHKDQVISTYRHFHNKYGKGNKIPVTDVIGSRMRLSECSDDWLKHHGINRDGSSIANTFRHFQEKD